MKFPVVCCIATLLLVSTSLSAQRFVFLFGHAEYATAMGKLQDVNNVGGGVEAGLGVGMNKTFFTGTVGTTWIAAENSNSLGTLRYSPFKVGLRRYIVSRNLFLKADAGLANMKYSKGGSATSHFTSTFGAGLKFTGLEVIGDFTHVGTFGSWFSIKGGFTIGI